MSPLAQLNGFKSVMSSKQNAFHLPCQVAFCCSILILVAQVKAVGRGNYLQSVRCEYSITVFRPVVTWCQRVRLGGQCSFCGLSLAEQSHCTD